MSTYPKTDYRLQKDQTLTTLAVKNKLSLNAGNPNSLAGKVTLASGVATVNTTAVDSNSLIFTSRQAPGSSGGRLNIGTVVPGTSFQIVSNSNTDNGVIAWMIVN